MASLTLASPCITSTVFNSETNSNSRRDDSFSSYLKLIKESLAKDVSSDSGECPTTMRISIGKNQSEDGDSDIFRAEKYFSGVMDGDTQLEAPEKSPVSSSYKKVGKMSLQSRSVTESTCSETSANSRNTLLRSHRRKLSSSSSRRGRRFFSVFRCSCSGKDATRVEEDINGSKKLEEQFGERASFATKIEDGLTFMTLNSKMAARMTIQKETFGSPFIPRKSLTLLTPPSKEEEEEEDLRSETSSDLFEIESLSITGNPLFRPEMNAYAPSEASIEWSVTTASADEPKRPSRSSKPSMLLGCASNKSVDATTENYKKPERLSSSSYEQMFRVESLIPPLMRYHASHSRRSLDFTH
ncbi:hypothetical protein J5N97_006913 [Dioscorea zingiberensis]|uniref:Protein PHYTOCHROME KINASE SUBSTRATE 1-like n=1 Tax=Dioscorea zingiberensis TaxID=325984 RepID=A0A9D5DDL8_9LILI|nr:hypothetical protein J5N97_006913 [Dioscorea zingiberensis]